MGLMQEQLRAVLNFGAIASHAIESGARRLQLHQISLRPRRTVDSCKLRPGTSGRAMRRVVVQGYQGNLVSLLFRCLPDPVPCL